MGEGPAIVVLHGLFGAGRNWGSVARTLADRYSVLLVDLPNHGESPWSDEISYPAMAAAVTDLLRAEGLQGGVNLVGHSMGGKVAMTMALTAPQAVRRLVVVDIAPVVYRGHGNAEIIDALLALPLDRLKSRAEIDAALAPAIGDPVLRTYLLANLRRDGDAFSWRVNLEGLRAGLDALHGFPDLDANARFDGAALFIAGALSNYIDDAGRAAIADRFPMARVETIAGAGHWVHADAPAIVARAIADFMSA